MITSGVIASYVAAFVGMKVMKAIALKKAVGKGISNAT